MGFTRAVLVVALFLPARSAPASSEGRATLAVHVRLEFDRSITSGLIKTTAMDEAAAIWKMYGVELLWVDCDVRPGLFLDAVVERDRDRSLNHREALVLGSTTVAAGQPLQQIRVSFDALGSLIGRSDREGWLQERDLATALGRVLAHEIGHILLGAPAYHDPAGLMRATIPAADLARCPRSCFRLTPQSATRLQRRKAFYNAEIAEIAEFSIEPENTLRSPRSLR